MTSRPPRPSSPRKHDEKPDIAGSYISYLEYNKILRTWFVAFGVGVPTLLLVNREIAERLLETGELKSVATLFLIGATSQVVGAFINKIANWYVYRSDEDKENAAHWKYRFAVWAIEQFWIDIVVDVLTIIFFGIAIWQMLTVFAPQG